ncbi:MAG: NAD(P)H-dependent oxidoreductase [Pseudomonadota bacterium]
MTHILRIDASMRSEGSTTRALTDQVIDQLNKEGTATITTRDLADGIALIDEAWIGANFTDAADRDAAQQAHIAGSDALVAELKAADVVVIGVPVYNFGVPAALKAWVDQVARARETFRYTENGPVGLLEGKRAILVLASGGTEIDSEIDFATPYMRHVLGFIGIHDVQTVAAGRQMVDAEAAQNTAAAQIASLAA